MNICQTVVDSVADHRRRNIEGQMDLFGMSGDIQGSEVMGQGSGGGIPLPDIPEYSKSDLMRMEREVTGLYLSGHPMDEFRGIAKQAGAAGIGDILADFASEGGNTRFKDNQTVTVAGVIESVRTKPTRNNTLMAYLGLDDGSGSIELLAFQRAIDDSGGYMQVNTPVLATGRLSARDEKEPQIVVERLCPITDIVNVECRMQNVELKTGNANSEFNSSEGKQERKLYVKLGSEGSPEYERLKLIHMMFPGRERMVIHFSDTKKNVGANCIIHDALVRELCEMLGEENVVVR